MESPRARTAAWWVWVIAQAAIVALYAARVKLSGGYPEPFEATADLGLAVGQLILGMLLAPALFCDLRTGCRSAMPVLVFAVLAGRLAGRSAADTAVIAVVVLLWLAVAGLWSPWGTARLGITFLTIALPVLFYAALEYGSAPTSLHHWPWAASPVLGICSIRLHQGVSRPLLWLGGLLLMGLAARRGLKRRPALYCNVGNND